VQGLLDELRDHLTHANRHKFDGHVPRVTLCVNPRLRALTGRVFYDEKRIELSGYHLSQPYARQVAFKTLEHEMLHLYLDNRGLPSGHTALFKRLAAERNIPVWHALPYPRNRTLQAQHVYACPACGRRVTRTRRLSNTQRSACGDCCRVHNGGAFDARFVMRFMKTVAPSHSLRASADA
jgi:ribosomal protein L37AE/L43A